MNHDKQRERVAFWFRYGAGDHAELFHALPQLVDALHKEVDIHYFGMKGSAELDDSTAAKITQHQLPLSVNRASHRDKLVKTLLWYACLPFIALHSHFLRINTVIIDETLPLVPVLSRLFFGRKRAQWAVDSFADIYLGEKAIATRIINRLDLAAWKRSPLIFTKTNYAKQLLEDKGVPAASVVTVYDPCDMTIYRPVPKSKCRETLGLKADDLVLAHHGILHPNKGIDRVINALPGLITDYPTIKLLVVGDGPHRSMLEELTAELKVKEHVIFTGWLKGPEDVNTALCASDIGLVMRIGLESDHVHLTGALVHNMACGLPVLAAKLKGIQEVVKDGECGYLFDPGNMDDFQEQFRKLADDSEQRERLGKTSLERARELFTLERVAEQTSSNILKLVHSN